MQITDTILMVRPANFGFNEQTAESNSFQSKDTQRDDQAIRTKAIEEFDVFVAQLREAGVNVEVVEDTPTPIKPDAIFPNNWFSTHANGYTILYPMMTPNRRLERREDLINLVKSKYGFTKSLDFSAEEINGRILEGTGSMILDRPNLLVYACISPRTDETLLDEYCKRIGYKKVAFTALDDDLQEIYHTNVMMALGTDFVVICLDSVKNMTSRAMLLDYFEETGKDVIEISMEQMNNFAGNMLQVKGNGATHLVMSKRAFEALNDDQIEQIQIHTNILYADLHTIETYGGGSARCMMAEIFR
jgi:hypothetical protein